MYAGHGTGTAINWVLNSTDVGRNRQHTGISNGFPTMMKQIEVRTSSDNYAKSYRCLINSRSIQATR